MSSENLALAPKVAPACDQVEAATKSEGALTTVVEPSFNDTSSDDGRTVKLNSKIVLDECSSTRTLSSSPQSSTTLESTHAQRIGSFRLISMESLHSGSPNHDSSNSSTGEIYAIQRCSLLRLPVEIRNMIYRHVLGSSRCFTNPALFFEAAQPLALEERTKATDVDAAIMRTCRLIYHESLPVLYGANQFIFSNSENVLRFAGLHIGCCPSSRHIRNRPVRLSYIRSVYLKFEMSREYNPFGTLKRKYREKSWDDWKRLFARRSVGQAASFDLCEKLVLDFTEWQLGKEEGFGVGPLITYFADCKRIREVTVYGVYHQGTLERIESGLAFGDRKFLQPFSEA